MGDGYGYKCKKCSHEYSVFLGIGMLYPMEYEKMVNDIVSGKYGPDVQNLMQNTPYAAVDAGNRLFSCSRCGFWEVGKDLTIYAPDDSDMIIMKKYGDKTVGKLGEVPYVMGSDLKENYHVLKRHYHKCPQCGGRMHKAGKHEILNLPCPNCGERNEQKSTIIWD